MNKYIARLNLSHSQMLSSDEAAKAGIGHNVGDPLDILADDVTTYDDALRFATEARNRKSQTEEEARTVKVSNLVGAARAAHKVGLKADLKDAKWKAYVQAFTGAVTDGSIAKESSVLNRAIELESKKLLVPAVRAAENYVAAAKSSGKPVKAFENVFETVASVTRKAGAIPSYDEMAATDKDGNSKLFRPDEAAIKAKREAKKQEAEREKANQANVGPDDVAARFIQQFLDVSKNMDDASFDAEINAIAEALRASRQAEREKAEKEAKAAEASSAKDVGTSGRKSRKKASA